MEGMFTAPWFAALGSILLLDLILSGDNAILIALACKNLPQHQKFRAMLLGGFGAVFIRIICTIFATRLLEVPYLEFFGGGILLYIAGKLLTEKKKEQENVAASVSLWPAIRTILIADFIMSIDNVLSLAGVANTVDEGKWSLIICGLLISIPIVLCGAQFFLLLMKKLPVILYAGAGILAYTAAKLMVMDQALGSHLAGAALYMEIFFVLGVLAVGWHAHHQNKQQA